MISTMLGDGDEHTSTRPLLVSGGVQDPPRNWQALNHLVAVNNVLGRKGRVALTMLICLGVAMAGFALSKSLLFSYILLFLAGVALIAVFTMIQSLVQLITGNEMRGRVMSVYNVAFRGGMPMGNLATGFLVPIFTAPVVLAVNGALLFFLGLYFLMVQRKVAEL